VVWNIGSFHYGYWSGHEHTHNSLERLYCSRSSSQPRGYGFGDGAGGDDLIFENLILYTDNAMRIIPMIPTVITSSGIGYTGFH